MKEWKGRSRLAHKAVESIAYGESNGLRNMRSGRAIKKLKLDRRNGFGREIMVLNKFRVNETLTRTRINECEKTKDNRDRTAIGL